MIIIIKTEILQVIENLFGKRNRYGDQFHGAPEPVMTPSFRGFMTINFTG